MKLKSTFLAPRNNTGQVALELSIACLLLIPLSILGCALLVCQLATSINDRACRDAARAAADASDHATALKRAHTAIAAHSTSGPLYGPVQLDESRFVFQDYNGNIPPNTTAYVSVTTNMPCSISAPIYFVGTRIGVPMVATITRTYRFPVVKLKLYAPL